MKTEVRIVEDSIWKDHRVTTMEVTLHRFVLAEFNTHRVFSRNSASSRAIPVQKQLGRVMDEPAFPLKWPREQKGMQGGEELESDALLSAQMLIADLHAFATTRIEIYIDEYPNPDERLHKSVINRYLEPFMWHTIVVTATEWDNFFGLRCSPLAQPEIRVAAELMRDAYQVSVPNEKGGGQTTEDWHLPYLTYEEKVTLPLIAQQIVSVARCARVSSLHAGDINDYEQDHRLYNALTTASPMHASPLEHVAVPCGFPGENHHRGHANFDGWHQLRHWENRP